MPVYCKLLQVDGTKSDGRAANCSWAGHARAKEEAQEAEAKLARRTLKRRCVERCTWPSSYMPAGGDYNAHAHGCTASMKGERKRRMYNSSENNNPQTAAAAAAERDKSPAARRDRRRQHVWVGGQTTTKPPPPFACRCRSASMCLCFVSSRSRRLVSHAIPLLNSIANDPHGVPHGDAGSCPWGCELACTHDKIDIAGASLLPLAAVPPRAPPLYTPKPSHTTPSSAHRLPCSSLSLAPVYLCP